MKTTTSKRQKFALFFIAGILAIFSTVHAQQQQTSNETALATKFGIKGGLNLTNLSSESFTDNHLKPGFNVGIFSKIPVTPGFSVQPELLYSLKGSKTDYNNFVEGTGQYRFNLGYVELPILAVINLPKNFYLQLGGDGAYLTKTNVKEVKKKSPISNITDLNEKNF